MSARGDPPPAWQPDMNPVSSSAFVNPPERRVSSDTGAAGPEPSRLMQRCLDIFSIFDRRGNTSIPSQLFSPLTAPAQNGALTADPHTAEGAPVTLSCIGSPARRDEPPHTHAPAELKKKRLLLISTEGLPGAQNLFTTVRSEVAVVPYDPEART